MVIGDRGIDALAVERSTPLHAALIAAGPDEGVPDERAGPGVEHGVDAALAAVADDVAGARFAFTPVTVIVLALATTVAQPHHIRARAAEIPFLAVGFSRTPGDGGRH